MYPRERYGITSQTGIDICFGAGRKFVSAIKDAEGKEIRMESGWINKIIDNQKIIWLFSEVCFYFLSPVFSLSMMLIEN